MGQIFENYMDDASISQEKKNYVIQKLNEWMTEEEWDTQIETKYPWKYWGASWDIWWKRSLWPLENMVDVAKQEIWQATDLFQWWKQRIDKWVTGLSEGVKALWKQSQEVQPWDNPDQSEWMQKFWRWLQDVALWAWQVGTSLVSPLIPNPIEEKLSQFILPLIEKWAEIWKQLWFPEEEARNLVESALYKWIWLPKWFKQDVWIAVWKWVDMIKEWIANTSNIIPEAAWNKAWALERRTWEQIRQKAEDIAFPTIQEMSKKQTSKEYNDIILETNKKWETWIFSKERIIRSPIEWLAIEETKKLLDSKKLKWDEPYLTQRNVINNSIEEYSKELVSNLWKDSQLLKIWKENLESIRKDIQNELDKNPLIVWDVESSINKLNKQLEVLMWSKKEFTAQELLQLRKNIDITVKKYLWEWVFNPDRYNAFSFVLKKYRQWINDTLNQLFPNAKVRELLDRQQALYKVSDTIHERFLKRPKTIWEKLMRSFEKISTLPRTEMIETISLLWWVWVLSYLWWAVPAAAWLWLWTLAYKWLTWPKLKARIAKILRWIEKLKLENPKDKVKIEKSETEFMNLLEINWLSPWLLEQPEDNKESQ